ncbi:MAG: tRNA 2-thiouridine(34) synthase MnmA [Chloroflexota bacterium]|nr:tRNA 2-thiouridine(34) synthase MnmA [Chloroflexota bacterium]
MASTKDNRVVVAMSGGVDSSVAALLLQRQGYDVVGVTMKLYSLDQADLPDYYRGCCTVDDVEDARTVCRRLGIPHYVLNVQREFQDHVIDYFCREYQQGRTPHPCIACNDKIKFNFLSTRASILDARYVATGHYARIEEGEAGFVLKKGLDTSKDQSYVLFGMGQEELGRTLMPVGGHSKEDIRQMALEAEFPNAEKPDSQDICFIPFGDYKAFLEERITTTSGDMVDQEGRVLGQHKGIEFFTVGQRRGLGIAGGEPMYVTKVEPDTNRVVVGPESALYRDTFSVSRVNYVGGQTPAGSIPVNVKIRYKFEESPAVLHPQPEGALVRFERPQRAITPGQAAVFYQDDTVLGGGFIV